MVIKIEANKLSKFIKKVSVNGTLIDMKLQFKEDGLYVCGKDAAGVLAIDGFFKKDNFSEYEVVEMNVKDTSKFATALSNQGNGMINIVKENNMINIIDKNGSLNLVEAENITSFDEGMKEKFDGLTYDGSVDILKSSVTDILNKNKIVKANSITIENNNNELTFNIGEEIDKAVTKSVSVLESEIKTKFQMSYFELVNSVLADNVKFNFGKEGLSPAKIEEVDEKYNINYYLVPLSE